MYTEVITLRKSMEQQLSTQEDLLRKLSTPIIPVNRAEKR